MDIFLDGEWRYKMDPSDKGIREKWYSIRWVRHHLPNLGKIQLPNCMWNKYPDFKVNKAEKTQKKAINKAFCQARIVWFFVEIPDFPYRPESHEYSIEFEGINYESSIWINGRNIGEIPGGGFRHRLYFPPEILSVTKNNFLVVQMKEFCSSDALPLDRHRWIECLGIFRRIKLLILERTRIKRIKVRSKLIGKDANQAKIHVEFIIKNPQEFLDRCYAFRKDPQITYELFYLGRFFNGEQQSNKVLIETNTIDVSPHSVGPLEHIGHDQESLQNYFADAYSAEELIDGTLDLATYFSEDFSPVITETQESREPGLHQETPEIKLQNSFNFKIKNPVLWAPNHPHLYQLSLHLHGIDQDKHIRFGIREVHTEENRIYLNQKPYHIKAITYPCSLMTDKPKNLQTQRNDLLKIKSWGFNTIRLSHGVYDKELFSMADEEGLLALVDFILTPKWNKSLKHQRNQKAVGKLLFKHIHRDINHPSIIAWVLGKNLSLHQKPIKQMVKTCMVLLRKWDPARLITYSSRSLTYKPLQKKLDVISLELNIPTNFGLFRFLATILETLHYEYPHEPILLTQFGFSSKPSNLKESPTFTEKLSYLLLQHVIPLFNNHSSLSGWILWNFKDFPIKTHDRSPRLKYNHTGLLNKSRQPKKFVKIFPFIMNQQKYYQPTPFRSRIIRCILKLHEFFGGKIIKFFTFRKH